MHSSAHNRQDQDLRAPSRSSPLPDKVVPLLRYGLDTAFFPFQCIYVSLKT